jgi:hypothetical protein
MMRLLLILVVITMHSVSGFGMSIEVQGNQVILSGPINGTECSQFRSVLQQSPIHIVVLTRSKGGDAKAGYCVGDLIRRSYLPTVIRGTCNSSCSIMWLGGVSRTLDGSGSRVGLHGAYDHEGNLSPRAPAYLQTWIPLFAAVNKQLMKQWTTLPTNKYMMRFYNDRAELCDHGRCTLMPGWNALNAGLATQ